MFDWIQEKIAGAIIFISMTCLSWQNNVLGVISPPITRNPYTFEVINTIVKGCINAIFTIGVVIILHFIKKKWLKGK